MSNEIELLQERVKVEFKHLQELKDPETGLELYPVFNTLPGKKDFPDYYIIITNPVSFNTLRKRIPNYTSAMEFLNDVAQIPWNAKTYNAKESEIYRYANVMEGYLNNTLLKNLQKFYPELKYPDLGPLPEDQPANVPSIHPSPMMETKISSDQLPKKINITFKKQNEPAVIQQQPNNSTNTQQQPVIVNTIPITNTSKPTINNVNESRQPMQQEKVTLPVREPSNPIIQQTTSINQNVSSTTTNSSKENTPVSSNISMTQQRSSFNITSYNNNKIPSAGNKKTHVRRGRPPIIDLPYIQRMKNILKVLKREPDPHGSKNQGLLSNFEKLPDRSRNPQFYQIVPNAICIDDIWKKIKARKYKSFGDFQDDFNLLMNDFQTYYTTVQDMNGLAIMNILGRTLRTVTAFELKKPDSDYIPEGEFRYPMDEVVINGKTFLIGDWVFLNNPNDPNKPIVAQIFRFWTTPDGKKWLNACWYFRPEQTVHRADRLFYKNEVMKTGQYRDHPVEDIIGKCFVIHFTRFQRNDPIINLDGPLFICEFRYNENDKIFNKIRTWRACLPEEIRDVEDENVPVNGRKFFKYPSPIKHLLPPNATFEDPIPEPRRGLPNAPPLVGAVYIRPKVPRDDLGEYATSDECPRYIIRPGDPQEEGQIDYENGTILTNSSTHGSAIPRRVDSSTRMNNGSPGPSGSHPKYVTNADKMRDTMKVDPLKLQDQNMSRISITNSNAKLNQLNNNPITGRTYPNPRSNMDAMNLDADNFGNLPIEMLNGRSINVSNHTPYKNPSRNGSRFLSNSRNNSNPQMVAKQQQKSSDSFGISSLLKSLQAKNPMSHILIDTPKAFTLPPDLIQRNSHISYVDHGNLVRRYTRQEIALRRDHNIANEALWFRGPGISITERVINLGDRSFNLTLNKIFEIKEPKEIKKVDTKEFQVEEVEEIVVRNPLVPTQDDIVISTTPLVNGFKTLNIPVNELNNDSNDVTTSVEKDKGTNKPFIEDINSDIAGPFVNGLRASSAFLAYKLRNIAAENE